MQCKNLGFSTFIFRWELRSKLCVQVVLKPSETSHSLQLISSENIHWTIQSGEFNLYERKIRVTITRIIRVKFTLREI